MTLYKDGPATSVELLINAPANKIWSIVTDPSLPVEASAELDEARWEAHVGDGPNVGSEIFGKNSNERYGEWTTSSFVTAWQPGKKFEWAVVSADNPAALWGFELEARGGQTLLRQSYRMGPGRSGMSMVIEAHPDREEELIAKRLHNQSKNMMGTLETVKAKAEAPRSWFSQTPRRSVEIQIDASPSEVWALVSDPTFPNGKSRELDEASWGEHPSGSPGVGSTIIGHNSLRMWGEWTTTSWVSAWEPNRRFEWIVHDQQTPISSWVFELEAFDGGTKLTQQVTLGPGRSGITKMIHDNPDDEAELVEQRLSWQAKNMMANLEAVKVQLAP